MRNADNFEWDDNKAAANARKHGVSFEEACIAFRDVFAVEELDDQVAYGEERFVLIGMKGDRLLTVIYTERNERIRIISAREATKYERENYYRKNAS